MAAMADDPRSKSVQVRLNRTESEWLADRAGESGVKPGTYLRMIMRGRMLAESRRGVPCPGSTAGGDDEGNV